MPKKMLLIDGFAIIHRSFHALPDFTAPDGTHVNVVYGFFSTLLKAVRDIQPDYLAVAFDLTGPTLRHKVFAEYKAQRPEAPAGMAAQIPLVKELVESLKAPILAVEGYEAEDVIATTIAKTKDQNLEYVIVTGDQDTLQLASDQVKIYFLRKGLSEVTLVDGQGVQAQYGIKPSQMIDVKALRGDVSDNIPGLQGIGEKTAVDLVKQFGSIERIFVHLADLPDKHRRLLEGQAEKAILNKQLVTIRNDAPLEFSLNTFRWSEDRLRITLPILERYGMNSLIKRVTQPNKTAAEKNVPKVEQKTLL